MGRGQRYFCLAAKMTPLHSAWIQVPILLASVFALERSANAFLDSVSAVSHLLQVDESLIALLTAGAEWEEVRPRMAV